MTTNKPTTYWASSAVLAKLESRHNNAPCILTDGPAEFNDVALVRLADYEALQDDRDQQYDMKVKAREQRNAVTVKLKALQTECDKLRGLLAEIGRGCSRRDMPSEQTIASWAEDIDAAMQRDNPC